jgi:hypothetical protein
VAGKYCCFVRSLLCCCLFSPSLPALAQQSSPQQGNAAASSLHPRHSGLKIEKGPPLGVNGNVGAFSVQGVSAYELLQNVTRKYNIVIGMEGVMSKTDPKINLDFAGGTVANLLDAFVAAAPDYRWQNDDGIIHIFRNGAAPQLANVVLSYPGATAKLRFQIWRQIHTLPEYVGWMNSYQCRAREQSRLEDFRLDDGPIDIAAGQMTVAQLLDQGEKKSGDGFWAVLQSNPTDRGCQVSVIAWSW